MHCELALLARHNGLGSVARCSHGSIHVQLGLTTLTLSETQYLQFVALLCDSAAAFEVQRDSNARDGSDGGDRSDNEITDTDYPGFLTH